MERKPLLYIAGPYSKPDPVLNTHRALKIGLELYDTGKCAVFVPHLMMVGHLIEPRSEGYWYAMDIDVLRHSDAMYRIPGESPGSDREEILMQSLNRPVFHSMTDALVWLDHWRTAYTQETAP